MGIYDRGIGANLLGGGRDWFVILLGAVVIVVIAAVALFAVAQFFAPKPLELWFDKTPITSGETVWLHVKMTNVTGGVLNNVIVSAEAVDKSAIQISQTVNTISVLGAGESREIKFLVNPVSQTVLSGNYTIKVSASSGSGLLGGAEITLTVQKQA
ncbi:MAG: hypothetical protein V1676_04390 [Candidatus Diapherotrites archaeon]